MEEIDGRTLRLFYSQRDFALALSALDFFMEVDETANYSHVELRRFRCYLDEATIAYCRPFTQARGMPLLSFSDLALTPDPDQLDLHDRLLKYRHKVVAHSDVERMRIAVSAMKPFGDSELLMPIMNTDEGLEFIPERLAWMIWLRTLRSALAKVTFNLVQGAGEDFRVTKDYMTNRPTKS
jgi:hypothetical protein